MITTSAETASAKPSWTRFSLRALLLATLAAAVLLGAVRQFEQVRRQRAVVREIEVRGGLVTYFTLKPIGPGVEEIEEWGEVPPGPALLRSLFGDHFFADGLEVQFVADSITTYACSADGQSGSTTTEARRFRDADLPWLELLPRLDMINLNESAISQEGAARLQRRFPGLLFVD